MCLGSLVSTGEGTELLFAVVCAALVDVGALDWESSSPAEVVVKGTFSSLSEVSLVFVALVDSAALLVSCATD